MGICDETCEFFGDPEDLKNWAVEWDPTMYTYCRKPGETCVILKGRDCTCYIKKASLLFDK